MPAITLPPRCDRAAADALLPELIAASRSGKIEIDATQLEQVGQAMLQLLVSARASSGGAEITPSAALSEAARMSGLADALFGDVAS
jgi:anti-anti-sigma regulatory factor